MSVLRSAESRVYSSIKPEGRRSKKIRLVLFALEVASGLAGLGILDQVAFGGEVRSAIMGLLSEANVEVNPDLIPDIDATRQSLIETFDAPTATATPTATRTPTRTRRPSPTPSRIPTERRTATQMPTNTDTPTATPTKISITWTLVPRTETPSGDESDAESEGNSGVRGEAFCGRVPCDYISLYDANDGLGPQPTWVGIACQNGHA